MQLDEYLVCFLMCFQDLGYDQTIHIDDTKICKRMADVFAAHLVRKQNQKPAVAQEIVTKCNSSNDGDDLFIFKLIWFLGRT